MNLDEMYALREKMENKIIQEERNKEGRREMIIRKFKEFNNGQEPTEEQIKEDWDYLDRCNAALAEKIKIPIIGPYEDKEGEVAL